VGKIRNIMDVLAWRLCMGCGACFAACTKGGVVLSNIENVGIRPVFKKEICTDCTDCLDVCSGYKMDARFSCPESEKEDPETYEIGPVLEVWEGYSLFPDIRHKASSGGVVSALALFCLEKENMAGVIHTGMDEQKPYLNKTVISKTREEILSRAGSRYAPASPCEGMRELRERQGRHVFVGKPCDAAGAMMLARKCPDLDEKIGLVVTFFCAGTPSTRGTLDLLQSLDMDCERLRSLHYRGEGWPGRFRVRESEHCVERSMPYMETWSKLTKYVAYRCRLCPHGVGHVSDVACGDAWQNFVEDSGNHGLSIVLVRTERGRQIVRSAREAGYLELRQLSSEDVVEAQIQLLTRRRHLFGRLLALRLLTVPVPSFTNFRLFESWNRLSIKEKARSIAGTFWRAMQRRWWKRTSSDA